MLWLLAVLLAAPTGAKFGVPGAVHLDDLELASSYFQNPASAETMVLGKRVVFVARVESIRRSRTNAGRFEVELGPRTTPVKPVLCELSRSQAAVLSRGQLIVAVGRMASDERASMHLAGCRIGYDFKSEPANVAYSFETCIRRFAIATCAKPGGCSDKPTGLLAMVDAYTRKHPDLKPAVRCDNPVLGILANCYREKDAEQKLRSCRERSEVVDILNEQIANDDGETHREIGHVLGAVHPERSALLDAAIRGGALPDEEP